MTKTLTMDEQIKTEEVTNYLWNKYYSENDEVEVDDDEIIDDGKGEEKLRQCVGDYIKASKVNGFYSNYEKHGDDFRNLTSYWVIKITKILKLKYKRSLDKKFTINLFRNIEKEIVDMVSLW